MIADTAVTWPAVALAAIAAIPGIIAAIASLRVHREIRTPSGTSLGSQTEATLHGVLGNNYRLRTLTNGETGPEVTVAQEHERKAATADPAGAPPPPAPPTTLAP